MLLEQLHDFYTSISGGRSSMFQKWIGAYIFGAPPLSEEHFRILKESFPEIIDKARSLSEREITKNDSAQITAIFKQTYPDEDALIKHHLGLDTWVTEGNKEDAVTRILYSYKYPWFSALDLNNLGLTSLPEGIGNLSHLKRLYISQNQLSELPRSIGNLTKLETLLISNNRLSALPEEINNLEKLANLIYSHNQIENEPQITIAGLRIHVFHDNPFSQERVRAPIGTPEAIISYLGETAETPVDLERFSPLGLDVDTSLHLWLIGLVSSAEFTNGTPEVQAHFANRALSVLNYAVENEHFRAVSMAYLADQTCDDRATKALDDLEILKELEEAGGLTIDNAIKVFTKSYIVQLSDAIAKERMPSLPDEADEIEVYLAYRQNVAKRLGINLGSTYMRYEEYAHLTEEDYERAYQSIQEALQDTEGMVKSFLSHRTWKELLDKTYVSEKEEYLKEKAQASERLERRKNRMSEGVYLTEYNRITAERAALEQKWYKEKTESLLTKKRAAPNSTQKEPKKRRI